MNNFEEENELEMTRLDAMKKSFNKIFKHNSDVEMEIPKQQASANKTEKKDETPGI